MKKVLLLIILVMAVFISCTHDPEELIAPVVPDTPANDTSAVVFDMTAVPYPLLSTYNFYAGPMADLEPVEGVLPYDVITPLFSDYAHKKRFIWIANGGAAQYVDGMCILDFADDALRI